MPPIVSAVINTRRMPGLVSIMRWVQLELHERNWIALLDIAEFREAGKVIFMSPFPRAIVRLPPEPGVVRRPRVRKQRYRLIGPHAAIHDVLPEFPHGLRIVVLHLD